MSSGLYIFFTSKKSEIDKSIFEAEVNGERDYYSGYKSVWGHPIIKILNCKLVYSSKESDLCIFDEELFELKIELEIILNKIDLVSNITCIDKEDIETGILNTLEYIRIAEKYKDQIGVYIG